MTTVSVEKIGDKTRQSIKWSLGLQVFQKVFFFISSIALARLLSPKDFGLSTIALTLDTLTWLASSLGINAAVIHFQDNVEERLNAAFWLYLVTSTFFIGLQLVSSPWIAAFYKAPIVADIIKINCIAMFITCFGISQRTALIKNLEFKSLSIIDGVTNLLKSIMYVVFAFMGFGVWSFIYPKLVTAVIGVTALWRTSRWRPKWNLNFKYWLEMFKYGQNVLLSNILDYVLNNSSYILIGSMVGPAALGVYTFAYDKSMMLVNNIAYPITMVSFSTFAKLQEHAEKLKDSYYSTVKFISLMAFPYAIGQIVLGREYITVIFGHKWDSAILIFQMILVYSALRAICQTANPMLQAVGRPDVVLKWNLAFAPVFILSIFLGFKLAGINGIGAATTLTGSLGAIIYMIIAVRTVNWPFSKIRDILYPQFISALSMGVIVYFLKRTIVYFNVPSFVTLFTLTAVGLLIYAMVLKIWFKPTFKFVSENMAKFMCRG